MDNTPCPCPCCIGHGESGNSSKFSVSFAMALWNWGEEAGSGRISSNSSCMRLQPRSFTQCHRNPAKERGREGSQLPGHAARRRHRHPQNARSSLKYVGRFALPHGVLCACREGACVSGRGAARTHMRVRQPAHPVKPFKPGVLHQGGCAPLPAQPVTRVTHQAGRGGACQWLQPTVRCSLGALPWKPNSSPPPPGVGTPLLLSPRTRRRTA